jgi:hypothetical protein
MATLGIGGGRLIWIPVLPASPGPKGLFRAPPKETQFPRLGFTRADVPRKMSVYGFGCAVAVCERFAVVLACRVSHAFFGN